MPYVNFDTAVLLINLQSKIKNDCNQSFLAGETRFEHATNGFGDHYSTVEPLPYESYLIIYYIVYEVNRNIEVFYEL